MKIYVGPENQGLLAHEYLFDENDWELEDRNGEWVHLRGTLLGMGSSQRDEHSHGGSGMNGEFSHDARQITQRCPACRWSELYVFHVQSALAVDAQRMPYCVYTLGPSIVRGETTRVNLRWASSGFEVVELALVRRGDRGAPYLPAANARALAMAADRDERIADAYVNRAVA
jgi:hypothetical protein